MHLISRSSADWYDRRQPIEPRSHPFCPWYTVQGLWFNFARSKTWWMLPKKPKILSQLHRFRDLSNSFSRKKLWDCEDLKKKNAGYNRGNFTTSSYPGVTGCNTCVVHISAQLFFSILLLRRQLEVLALRRMNRNLVQNNTNWELTTGYN
jgi:hypothetical protein